MSTMSPNRLSKQDRSDVRWWAWFLTRWGIATLVGVLLLAAVIGLGWKRYYGRASLDIDAKNRRASFERQDTDRADLLRYFDQWTGTDPSDTAHRAALMDRMCATYGEVRGSVGNYPALQSTLDANC